MSLPVLSSLHCSGACFYVVLFFVSPLPDPCLQDMDLPICGTERKVSPPNLPTPPYFVPLGRLLGWVAQGNQLVPVHVDDIKSGESGSTGLLRRALLRWAGFCCCSCPGAVSVLPMAP